MLLELVRSAPGWRDIDGYEAGPSGGLLTYLARQGRRITTSFYRPDVARGKAPDAMGSPESLTLGDETFDVVITQNVLEHVLRPIEALAEIAGVVRPHGVHIFTVPYTSTAPTATRPHPGQHGEIVLLAPAEYHGEPLNPGGVLMLTDWETTFLRSCGKPPARTRSLFR